MAKWFIGASLLTALALVVVPALAAVSVSAQGEVTAIDTVAGNFTLASEGDVYTVIPPVGFDLTTLNVGDQVSVEGSLAGGVITATSLEILPEGEAVDLTGEVTAIGATDFEIQSEGNTYTVVPPGGFDLGTLAVGDMVHVTGLLAVSTITADLVEIVPPEGVFVEEYGFVSAVSDTGFEFTNLDGETRSVIPPEDFDLASLVVGDFVCVHGDLADSTITAEEVAILEAIQVTGQVTALGGEDYVAFTMQASDGNEYDVIPVGDIDLSTLTVGAQVSVSGFLNVEEEGLEIFATSIEILPTKGGAPNAGNFCTNPDQKQPALNMLATLYGADYGQLLNYFCIGHYGVGEIGLALQTAALANNGMTAGDILALKTQLGGWGQVWLQLGLKGK